MTHSEQTKKILNDYYENLDNKYIKLNNKED